MPATNRLVNRRGQYGPYFTNYEEELGNHPLFPSTIFYRYTGLEYANVHTNVHTFSRGGRGFGPSPSYLVAGYGGGPGRYVNQGTTYGLGG